MKNLTEFLESNCELQEEEMQTVSGGSDLANIGSGLAVATTDGALEAAGATYNIMWEIGNPFWING